MIQYFEVPEGLPEALRRLIETGAVRRDSHAEDFRIISRMRAEVGQLLAEALGCRLHVGLDHYALALKPAAPDLSVAPDWLVGRGGLGLAVFFYVFWYAEQSGEDTAVLSQIADAVRQEAEETGVSLDWTRRQDRRLLQLAMEHFRDRGFAVFREGSTEEWVEETGAQNLLVEWRHTAWREFLPMGPDLASRILNSEMHVPAAEEFLERPSPRQRLLRWLLFHPILLASEDPEAFDLLMQESEEEAIREDLRTYFALELELADTFARARRRMTEDAEERPAPMNLQADEAKVAVLLAAEVRRRMDAGNQELRPTAGSVPVTETYLRTIIEDLHQEHGDRWKTDFRTGSSSLILRKVLPRMLRLGLARPGAGGDETDEKHYLITPAAAPLRPFYPEETV